MVDDVNEEKKEKKRGNLFHTSYSRDSATTTPAQSAITVGRSVSLRIRDFRSRLTSSADFLRLFRGERGAQSDWSFRRLALMVTCNVD